MESPCLRKSCNGSYTWATSLAMDRRAFHKTNMQFELQTLSAFVLVLGTNDNLRLFGAANCFDGLGHRKRTTLGSCAAGWAGAEKGARAL
eukprot:1711817-Amphidinium_carterae.1